jgi:hypothetical protein
LTGLESAVLQLTFFCKIVKQEVDSTVILPPLVFPERTHLDVTRYFRTLVQNDGSVVDDAEAGIDDGFSGIELRSLF